LINPAVLKKLSPILDKVDDNNDGSSHLSKKEVNATKTMAKAQSDGSSHDAKTTMATAQSTDDSNEAYQDGSSSSSKKAPPATDVTSPPPTATSTFKSNED
jgi:hypothetical protein